MQNSLITLLAEAFSCSFWPQPAVGFAEALMTSNGGFDKFTFPLTLISVFCGTRVSIKTAWSRRYRCARGIHYTPSRCSVSQHRRNSQPESHVLSYHPSLCVVGNLKQDCNVSMTIDGFVMLRGCHSRVRCCPGQPAIAFLLLILLPVVLHLRFYITCSLVCYSLHPTQHLEKGNSSLQKSLRAF